MTWLAKVGGPKRGQVTALQRALLYLAVFVRCNTGAARQDLQSLNVMERTDMVRVKNCTKNVGKSDRTVRTWNLVIPSEFEL